jgi:hypothetical protein
VVYYFGQHQSVVPERLYGRYHGYARDGYDTDGNIQSHERLREQQSFSFHHSQRFFDGSVGHDHFAC